MKIEWAFLRFIPAVLLTLALHPAAATAPLARVKSAPAAVSVWPSQAIHLVIGFPGGSVQDLSARAIAEPLSKALGQAVIVENKPGAAGTIAAGYVAKAKDQHTFGVMNNSQLTIAKLLNPSISYDPATDLAPIALIATAPLVLVVSDAATGKTSTEWLLWLQAQGNKASYGSPGTGTPGHVGMELIKSRAGGLDFLHVPYAGNPQVINALLGGQIQAALLPPGLAMQHVRSGKLKALGVTTEKRSALAPELPTLRDVGIEGAEIELFSALAGPATLSEAIRSKLSAAVIEVVKNEETRLRLIAAGWQPTPSTSEGLRIKMRQETRFLGGIIMSRGIRSDS